MGSRMALRSASRRNEELVAVKQQTATIRLYMPDEVAKIPLTPSDFFVT